MAQIVFVVVQTYSMLVSAHFLRVNVITFQWNLLPVSEYFLRWLLITAVFVISLISQLSFLLKWFICHPYISCSVKEYPTQ